MAIQKDFTIQGGITIVDAIHEVKAVNINGDRARVRVASYKDATEQSVNNHFAINSYRVTDSNFTVYFDTPDGSKTVMEKAQDYLVNEVVDFSGATVI